jgi:hypothetical protein
MGLLDRIEKKTMSYWVLELALRGLEVRPTDTLCLNTKTYECKRRHKAVSFDFLGVFVIYYRCAGEIWANFVTSDNMWVEHVGAWNSRVEGDAEQITRHIDARLLK